MTSFAQHVQRHGGHTLTAFGDSITAGASVAPDVRWATQLAALLGLSLHNKGISGRVLQNSPDADGKPRPDNGLSRWEHDLLGSERGDYLPILYGTNDARHTGAPDTFNLGGFVRDYRALLGGLTQAGYAPANVCIGSPVYFPDAGFAVGDNELTGQSRDVYLRFVEAVKALAREFGTFYAPIYESMQSQGGDTLALPDLIHPNPAGHAVIADAFANATLIE